MFDTRDRIAGTFDKLLEINGELNVIDVKVTSGVYATHRVQTQVYAHLLNLMGIPVTKANVLRLGTKHKAGFEYVEQDYDPAIYDRVFMACLELWQHAHDYRDGPSPEEQLPDEISLPNVALAEPPSEQHAPVNRINGNGHTPRWTRRRR